MTKLEVLLEKYQGNAYPDMIDDLAFHLGVTADSVRRIAPGWAPIVPFKKGKNFMGWWAIPERDAHAEVTGLSLRSQKDMKVMYPGSKHGLVYEVNPDHERGEKGYAAGAHNWIRVMDAGINCPVCGKPDGCIVSAENVHDPKAAVCIRTREGSVRPMKFGYLHLLKPEANLKGRSALADNGGPVLIVEGFSDTAAAMDLGFNAVGRPSNLACMDTLANLVRGRACVILGENDLKPDGTHPGKEGMTAAFQIVRGTCTDVKMVMPPAHVKDLRAWVSKFGLNRTDFDAYVEEQGQVHAENVILADDRPLTATRAYLTERYRMAGRYIARRWRGQWYVYRDGCYRPISDEQFTAPIRPWAHDKFVTKTNPTNGAVSTIPVHANTAFVDNVLNAIKDETLIDDDAAIPCWINGASGPDPTDMVVFSNGVLHLPTFFAGLDGALLDPTPDLFTTAALPFAFDPLARCPHWKMFLTSTLGDEADKIMLLREWIGYCMVPDKTMQKMLFMRGPTAAGKSEILNVICQLVGKGQYAATDFGSLAGSFGLSPLMGKLVCTIGDARVPRQGDAMRGLELLLNLTGNDDVQVNRKYKEQIDAAQLTARISMASNEFLELPDHASALLRRLLLIEFKRSFKDKPDTGLRRKLHAEIPGIAVWALEGLRRLRESKRFTMPASSLEAENEWRINSNPLAAFIEECCDVGAGEIRKDELFDAWTAWSTERRMRPTTKSRFHERMRGIGSGAITSETYERGNHKMSVYKGVALKAWAARKFTGRPV
jgi:putative DNA primase/helicase